MNTRKYLSLAIALATAASVATAIPVSADTTSPAATAAQHMGQWQGGKGGIGRPSGMKPGVFGTVASVSGTSLTVTGKQGFGSSTTSVTYTVDASNSVVKKDNATSSVSSIATGDTVMIQGAVSGTNVTATLIRDGAMMGRGMQAGTGKRGLPGEGSSTPAFEGNGEPVVAGSVSAVSGETITLTNKSNVTYTVDATNAKVVEGKNASATVSNIAVGDNIVVQGTVNGTSVAATTVVDQKVPAAGGANSSNNKGGMGGILGGIGSFFKHLFGF